MNQPIVKKSAANTVALESKIQRRLHWGKIRMLIIHTLLCLASVSAFLIATAGK